jgi:hypothetical protein
MIEENDFDFTRVVRVYYTCAYVYTVLHGETGTGCYTSIYIIGKGKSNSGSYQGTTTLTRYHSIFRTVKIISYRAI